MTHSFIKITLIHIILILFGVVVKAQTMSQIGYMPSSEKRLFLDSTYANRCFHVNDNIGGVYKGTTTHAVSWPFSGTKVCYADFSAITNEGIYKIVFDDRSETFSLKISKDIYAIVGKALVKSYYMARASEVILPQFAAEYARPSGHPDTLVYIHSSAASKLRPEGSTISSSGGWYDAGDYNKYIVNSAITTYTLLHTYELFEPQLKEFRSDIPESTNSVSDLLDETLCNLRWMLTMQDPNDGGVYHKLTSKNFTDMALPHTDLSRRYVVTKSTAAALDFAATMAKAYRVLQPLNEEFPSLADSCLNAAKFAYQWSLLNPSILYIQPSDIATGAYDDAKLDDEWFWASLELYYSTGEKSYVKETKIDDVQLKNPEWGGVNALAAFSLCALNHESGLAENDSILKDKLVVLADKYLQNYKQSAYRVSTDTFPWGSNSEIANQGVLLMHAYLLTHNQEYLHAADGCANYILGANPLGYCFITGFGSKSPMHIHDRRSEGDGVEAPIPGLLVGGPTKQAQYDCGVDKYHTTFQALSYLDMNCSFSTNEIAINWNASAAALFLGLDAIHKELANKQDTIVKSIPK